MTDTQIGLALKPSYPRPPIGSVETLAKILGSSTEQLWDLARRSDVYRRAGMKQKSDGTPRPLWEAKEPLKTIQGRIKSRILQIVEYPAFLQGALADRDYVTNAAMHTGKRALLSLDIASFYPGCTAPLIRSIWAHFFRFPPDVADLLTLLTTRDGSLPQGASPSSYLANLVFWSGEGRLVSVLESHHLTYTRFIDDIHVSSNQTITNDTKSLVIESVLGMIAPKGFTLHRGKLQISDRSSLMTVHRLNVKSRHPKLLGKKRDQIRATVHSLEWLAKESRSGREYRRKYLSARGRAAMLKRFHPKEGQELLDRIRAVEPVPSEGDVVRLRRRVLYLCRSSNQQRELKSFRRSLSRVQQELGEIKRARPRETQKLRRKIRDSGLA